MDKGSLVGYRPWGPKELDKTEQLKLPFFFFSLTRVEREFTFFCTEYCNEYCSALKCTEYYILLECSLPCFSIPPHHSLPILSQTLLCTTEDGSLGNAFPQLLSSPQYSKCNYCSAKRRHLLKILKEEWNHSGFISLLQHEADTWIFLIQAFTAAFGSLPFSGLGVKLD